MALIQLFIATYNRPTLVFKAINSALNQTFESYEVIVSDNSTNDETEILLSEINKECFKYKRRKPSLLPIDHLNAILSDVTADYFMIFHDDDVMFPEMLSELYKNIISDNKIIAVGANARIISSGIHTGKLMLKNKNNNLLICNSNEMVHQYLVKRGIVPFPSYLYKSEVAKKIRLNPDNGGKHCDVAFMMDITSMGNVLFLIKPLMNYYIHSVQDSRTNDFLHKIKLINFITNTSIYKKKSKLIKKFRIVNLYYELIQDKRNNLQMPFNRKIKLLKLIFKISPFDFFPRAILKLLIFKS